MPSPWLLAALSAGSMATSLAQNSMLASIGLASARHGPAFFGWMSMCLLGPSLPVALLQYASDDWLDRCLGARTAFDVRCSLPMLAQVVCLMLFPHFLYGSDQFGLVVLALVVGTASASLFGTTQQLAALADVRGGREGAPHVAFALGFQASGLVVLVTRTLTTFDINSSLERTMIFYSLIAALHAMCLAALLIVVRQLDVGEAAPSSPSQHSSRSSAMSLRNGLTLFVTVAASASLIPWLYPTLSTPEEPNLAQLAFLARVFFDALSRPATLVFSKWLRDERSLLTCALARPLILGPIFLFPRLPSQGILFLVGLFSFLSGFIVTRCYQLSHPGITPVINVVFSSALTLGVAIGKAWSSSSAA